MLTEDRLIEAWQHIILTSGSADFLARPSGDDWPYHTSILKWCLVQNEDQVILLLFSNVVISAIQRILTFPCNHPE